MVLSPFSERSTPQSRHGSGPRAHTVTVQLCVWIHVLCDHITYHTPSTPHRRQFSCVSNQRLSKPSTYTQHYVWV